MPPAHARRDDADCSQQGRPEQLVLLPAARIQFIRPRQVFLLARIGPRSRVIVCFSGLAQPKSALYVQAWCSAAARRCQLLAAAVAVTVAVSHSHGSVGPTRGLRVGSPGVHREPEQTPSRLTPDGESGNGPGRCPMRRMLVTVVAAGVVTALAVGTAGCGGEPVAGATPAGHASARHASASVREAEV